MDYVILCAGCSFTQCKNPGEHPYASFLPGQTYNIGKRGIGITSKYFKLFFERNKDVNLTHVVYQVPCPTRQPTDLNDFHENHFRVGSYDQVMKGSPGSIWIQLVKSSGHPCFSLQAFDKKDQYLKKAMDMVDNNVKLIREKQPNAKIIFFRYEHILKPLVHEFTKDFYKIMLDDYCKENDITYIYEENFNTKWFNKNQYAIHPNKAGAKLIADKIKEHI